jgi:UPF0755 protein
MTDLFEADATTTTSLDLRRLQRQQRRIARRKWTAVATAVGLVVFAIAGSVAWNFVQGFSLGESTSVADFDGAGQGTVQIVVEPGDSGASIAQTLYDAGVVASPEAFIREAAANADSSRIVPGYYFMQREMKAEFALLALLDPNNRDLLTFTIPEGQVIGSYFQRIADLTDYSLEEVEAAAADTEALGLPPEADGNLEGWLFPARYEFNPGAHPTDILSEMVATTIRTLDDRGVDPEDRQRILTIASLIEREAKLAEDRPMISGIIQNRLDIDMQLEFDSTVKYLSPSEGVFTSDDERAIDSPYNTYQNVGLPPGPIAGPGASSIEAAINPADHDYVFFVTVNLTTGETAYAESYNEHLRNVEILQEWYAENKS